MRSVKDTFIVESEEKRSKKNFWIKYYKGENRATSITGIKKKHINYYKMALEIECRNKVLLLKLLCNVLNENVFSERMYFAYAEEEKHMMYLRYDEKSINKVIQDYSNYNYSYSNLQEYIDVIDDEYNLSDVLIGWNSRYTNSDIYELVFSFKENKNLIELKISYDNAIDEEYIFSIVRQYMEGLKKEAVESHLIIDNTESSLWSQFANSHIRYKDEIALVDEQSEVTYRELFEKVCKIEGAIRKKFNDVSCFALIYERSIDYVASMLAIIKLKKVFVPIDSKTPIERMKYILDQIGGVYISNQEMPELSIYSEVMIGRHGIKIRSGKQFVAQIDKNARYIIYTSGTTGKPKGVIIGENSILNLNKWFSKKFLRQRMNVLAMTSISFDVSIEEILLSVINGSKVFLLSDNKKKIPEKMIKYIDKNKIELAQFVPESLRMLAKTNKKIDTLKYVICGGEALDTVTRDKVLGLGYRLFNHYGPTETTVDAITCECNCIDSARIIGEPITNYCVYIMDDYGCEVEDGRYGEISISGPGLALGYFMDSKKTSESFCYNKNVGKRLYKTGDYGRKTLEGKIEYIGRIDSQVKFRGHRIELQEIETVINRLPGVSKTKTIIEGEGISAYIEYNQKGISENKIKKYIKKFLPNYMIPQRYIFLEKLPTNINGKIDVKLLSKYEMGKKIDVELTVTERNLFRILEEKCHCIITDKNIPFDELGIDSFGLVCFAYEIQEKLCDAIEITDLFKYNTVELIANYIDGVDKTRKVKNEESVVLLRDNKAKENVFFVHPGNGEVHMFLRLTKYMSKKYNYYGIRYIPKESGPCNVDAERLAERYCKLIMEIQEDNFILIGHCIGGTIAFEMCRWMENRGKDVKFLGLINSFAPDREFWGKVTDFSSEGELKKIRFLMNGTGFDSGKIDGMPINEMWNRVYRFLDRNPDYEAEKFVYDDIDRIIYNYEYRKPKEIALYANIIRTLDRLRAKYNPFNKIQTNIHLFLANQEYAANYPRWKKMTSGDLFVKHVVGTNTSVFKEPNVRRLATELTESIG